MEKQRLAWLDIGRCFGALSVLLAHIIQAFSITHPTLIGNELYLLLGRGGVFLFFCISGFIIPYSLFNSGFKSFVINRFFRLFPIYWFAIIVTLLVKPQSVTLFKLLSNLFMIQGFVGADYIMYITWTLEIELIFYILCAVYYARGLLNNDKFIIKNIIFFLGLAIISSLIRFFVGLHIPDVTFLGLALMFTCVRTFINKSLDYRFYGLFLLLSIPVSYFENTVNAFGHISGYIIGIVMFLSLYNLPEFKNKILSFLGRISYSIYLLHVPIAISLFEFFLPRNPFAAAFFAIASVILVSYLTYKFIEVPFIGLGKKIVKSLQDAPNQTKILSAENS